MSRRLSWRRLLPLVLGVAMATTVWVLSVNSGDQIQAGQVLSFRGDSAREEQRRSEQQETPQGVWDDLRNRRQKVEEVCSRRIVRGRLLGIFVSKERHLAYCFVPKTGCTFWKQVFAFLNNHTGARAPITSPFNISRWHVHSASIVNGQPWLTVKNQVKDYFRFMFARDPYTRLWSAYIDKFLLPDFWPLFGYKILARRDPQPPKKAVACGKGVTFREFMEFSFRLTESHWAPVSSTCNPCAFRPDVVGKMETYTRDARAVLGHAGLDWILDGMDHDKHVRNELDMLIDYNFQVINKKKIKCVTKEELAALLWKAFQYNGYISDALSFTPLKSNVSKAQFKKDVMRAHEISVRNISALEQQKARIMENAYKELPSRLLKRLENTFATDFELFGYSPRTFS